MKYYEFILDENYWMENYIHHHSHAVEYLMQRVRFLKTKVEVTGEVTLKEALDVFGLHFNPESYMYLEGFTKQTGVKIKINKAFLTERDSTFLYMPAYLRFYCTSLVGEVKKEELFYDIGTDQMYRVDPEKIKKAIKDLENKINKEPDFETF